MSRKYSIYAILRRIDSRSERLKLRRRRLTVLKVIAGTALAIAMIHMIGLVGWEDFLAETRSVPTALEQKQHNIQFLVSTVAVAVSGALVLFSSRINQAIDRELERLRKLRRTRIRQDIEARGPEPALDTESEETAQ